MSLLYRFLGWLESTQPIPKYVTSPHLAICIGHSRLINGRPEGGAVSHDGKTNEWNYNQPLAILIRQELRQHGIRAEIISEYEGTSYGSAQRWLADRLRALDVGFALELHFNAADDPAANGHEWLYWHASGKSRRLAECLDGAIRQGVPDLTARGTKAKSGGDRGAEFLKGTHCPAVICEPFFGSNRQDWEIATTELEEIAKAYTAGILSFIAGPPTRDS